MIAIKLCFDFFMGIIGTLQLKLHPEHPEDAQFDVDFFLINVFLIRYKTYETVVAIIKYVISSCILLNN